jgi:hypothetical protein
VIKKHLGDVVHWHFRLNELRLQQCQIFGFHSEILSYESPTNLTADGCFAETQAFEWLNAHHKLLLFSVVMIFTAERNLSQASPFRV